MAGDPQRLPNVQQAHLSPAARRRSSGGGGSPGAASESPGGVNIVKQRLSASGKYTEGFFFLLLVCIHQGGQIEAAGALKLHRDLTVDGGDQRAPEPRLLVGVDGLG